jgi:hypothetical protein
MRSFSTAGKLLSAMKLPQISLREPFLLVIIAAMGCGWWVAQQREMSAIKQSESGVAELESHSNSKP